jgi:hypothetical protein
LGEVFSVPLANDQFWGGTNDRFRKWVDVPCLDGFWDQLPTFEEVAASRVMGQPFGPRKQLLHEDVYRGWFDGPFPTEFVILTARPLMAEEMALAKPQGTMVFQDPSHFAAALLEQWRWLFDRDALKSEWEQHRMALEAKEQSRLDKLSLSRILRERPFVHWSDMWPKAVVREAHLIFRDATNKLVELEGRSDSGTEKVEALKGIVDDFNNLYDKTGCIESTERHEIVQRIKELASLVGVANDDEELTGHRIW